MSPILSKFTVIFLISIGEGLSVYAELIGAHEHALGGQAFLPIFLKMFGIITLAGAFLIAGYILGYLSFRNIWILSVTSLTSILIMESMIASVIFHQWPTRGAWIGLIFGVAGLTSVLTL